MTVNEQKYNILKISLWDNINKFIVTDNLFDLIEAMKVGTKILENEKFPIKEFKNYNDKKNNG